MQPPNRSGRDSLGPAFLPARKGAGRRRRRRKGNSLARVLAALKALRAEAGALVGKEEQRHLPAGREDSGRACGHSGEFGREGPEGNFTKPPKEDCTVELSATRCADSHWHQIRLFHITIQLKTFSCCWRLSGAAVASLADLGGCFYTELPFAKIRPLVHPRVRRAVCSANSPGPQAVISPARRESL